MIRKTRFSLRIFSGLITLTFFLNDLAFAALDFKPAEIAIFQKALPVIQFPSSVAVIEDAWMAGTVIPNATNPSSPKSLVGDRASVDSRQKIAGMTRGSGKTIFLIQDAHTNESGQRNAAKALEIILKLRGSNKTRHSELRRSEESHLGDEILRRFAPQDDGGIKYVFLEAGTGDDSLSSIRARASLEKRK